MLWSAQEINAAIGGAKHASQRGSDNWHSSGISIDSRTTNKGDLFVALKGENYNGHDFVTHAADAGAQAAMVEKNIQSSIPEILVSDTLQSLEKMAITARKRSNARRIAITGSVGKTSTKHLISTLLCAHQSCHASVGSFNNHIGVPLSLARMPAATDFGVFELGMNHAGEITNLSALVAPHIAIITCIAESHIGHFATLEDIARAKAEIFDGLEKGGLEKSGPEKSGIVILNADDAFLPQLTDLAKAAGAQEIITVGKSAEATHRLIDIERINDGLKITASLGGDIITFNLGMTTTHSAWTALFGLAVAEVEGLCRQTSIAALANIGDVPGRGRQHSATLSKGRRITVIDDSYNASPASMTAAICDFAATQAADKQVAPQAANKQAPTKQAQSPRRIAILADMLELGEKSESLHLALAQPLRANPPDMLIAFGDGMKVLLDEVATSSIETIACADADAALERALELLRDGDVVLIKGSNGMKAWQIAQHLIGGNHAS